MTREDALNMLHGMKADNLNLADAYTKDKYEALDMAIKALEQQLCDDCISRQAVLDIIDSDWKYEGMEQYINELPPVTPQPKESEQGPILDKAIKEIVAKSYNESATYPERIDGSWVEDVQLVDLQDVLEIIQKYKAESDNTALEKPYDPQKSEG